MFSGLVTACLFADCPINFSLSVNATTEGVVLAPSEFSITFGFLPSMIATQELVVPKSIPITFAIFFTYKNLNINKLLMYMGSPLLYSRG